jgi:hypothetical protein
MGAIESGFAAGAKGICVFSCWTFGGVRVNETALNN